MTFERGFLHAIRIDRAARARLNGLDPEAVLVREIDATPGPPRPDIFGALAGLHIVRSCLAGELAVLPTSVRELVVDEEVDVGMLERLVALEVLSVPLDDDPRRARPLLARGIQRLHVGPGRLTTWLPFRSSVPELAVTVGSWRAEWRSPDGMELDLVPLPASGQRAADDLTAVLAELPIRSQRLVRVRGGRVANPVATVREASWSAEPP